jgi:hypothetical protein
VNKINNVPIVLNYLIPEMFDGWSTFILPAGKIKKIEKT